MIKGKKRNLIVAIVLFCMFALLSLFSANPFEKHIHVNAEMPYFSAEQYTESDQLLLPDGTTSTSETIRSFASAVKAAEDGKDFPALSQVVPLEYLESTEQSAVFAYNGNEYGFYMVKTYEYFDLLLIDFIYEFSNNDSDIEYSIRIEPILQCSFLRKINESEYQWTLYKSRQPRYYVANPRFMAFIQNENALNYGDPGYSKIDDDGLIILQSRLNYAGIERKEGEFWKVCTELAGERLLSLATNTAKNALNSLVPGGGTVISVMQDVAKLSSALYEAEIQTVIKENEGNMFTWQSKSTQRDSNNYLGYSRYAAFCPQPDTILAPREECPQPYAEFVVLLNDANYRTRLYQQCDFDIIALTGKQVSKDNKVSRTQVLFEEDSKKELEFQSSIPVYMLCDGTDKFIFNAEYASDYEIQLEWNGIAEVIVNGQNFGDVGHIKYYADSGENIFIETTTEEEVIIGTITISPNAGDTIDKIPARESYILQKDLSGVKKLSTGNSGLTISEFYRVKDGKLSSYTTYGKINKADEITYPFVDDTYYIVIQNNTATDFKSQNLSIADIQTLGIGVSNTVNLKSSNLNYFRIAPVKSGSYIITISNVSEMVFYYSLLTSELDKGSVEPVENGEYIVRLTAGVDAYFGLRTNAEEVGAKISLEQKEVSYQWKISGGDLEEEQTVSENTQEVTRGQTYTLSFWRKIGETEEDINAFIFMYRYDNSWELDTSDLTIVNGRITIPSDCPLGGKIIVRAKASDDTSYDSDLILVPTDQLSLYSVIIENSEDITVSIRAPQYVSRIDFSLSYGRYNESGSIVIDVNEANKSVIITEPKSILNLMQRISTPYDVKVTFNIDGLYYYDALKNEQFDSSYTYYAIINNYFASGDGTSDSPYVVNSARHLYNIRKNNFTYIQLVSDIIYPEPWEAIPIFTGTLLGGGHTITYVSPKVEYGQNYGFIAKNNGTIDSIHFKPTIEINGKSSSNEQTINFAVGGAVGENYGELYKVYIEKTVSPFMNTSGRHSIDLFAEDVFSLSLGGVCGYNYGTLEICYNYASLGGSANIGGIVGLNYESAQLVNCKNYGNIYYNHSNTANLCIAGIAGTVRDKGVVENCSNYATITWAARIAASSYTKPIIARLVAQICTSASDVNNYAGGKVVVIESIRLDLDDDQLVNVKDEKFAVTFNPPGSSSGGDDDGGGCVALGTLITLADGTQVPVESLTGNELLLVWDMRTGTFGAAPILFIDSDPYGLYNVIHLSFSDGTSLKVITEHALWDYNLNRYIFMDENASQYIGHWFNKQSMGKNGQLVSQKVQLVGVTVSLEYSVAYSPVTYSYLCYYVNGMLSMPGATEGLINIFEVDSETLMYDADAMATDIAQYGLFTYEEFVEFVDVPREIFDAFNGQYLKVSLGKGLITLERLQELVERYAEFFV